MEKVERLMHNKYRA